MVFRMRARIFNIQNIRHLQIKRYQASFLCCVYIELWRLLCLLCFLFSFFVFFFWVFFTVFPFEFFLCLAFCILSGFAIFIILDTSDLKPRLQLCFCPMDLVAWIFVKPWALLLQYIPGFNLPWLVVLLWQSLSSFCFYSVFLDPALSFWISLYVSVCICFLCSQFLVIVC